MAPKVGEHSHDPLWDPHKGANTKHKDGIMEWIEQGMDFFGCDENVPKNVFGANESPTSLLESQREKDPQYFDYAKLHDELLESLMAEASKRANDPNHLTDIDSSASSSFSFTLSSSQSVLNTSTASTANTSIDCAALLDEDVPVEGVSRINRKRGHKRPRALKLHRRVMPAITAKPDEDETPRRRLSYNSSFSSKSTVTNSSKHTVSNTKHTSSTTNKKSIDDGGDAVPISLKELTEAHLPPAASFIHPQCRMQKDKGKGEAAGSNICAKGRDHCLLKLQDKMALLTRVAFGEESRHRGKADMKRRPARIAEVFPNFTETRSIIELKMGFLSMQYGILLRWDTTRTGKVTLVVLRKMCHESFYTDCKPPQKRLLPPRQRRTQSAPELPTYAIRDVVDGNHAILQRPDGTEVALLDPPYRVNRPDEFTPTLLTVAVCHGAGLSHKSSWTVQLCYESMTENILLTWDEDQALFSPKLGKKLKHEVPINGSLDLPALEIRLFEHRQKLGKSRRCVSHMHVPMLNLEAQPSNQGAKPRDVKVTLPNDPSASIMLSVLLESDYAHWLRRELDARRHEEVTIWSRPARVVDLNDDSLVALGDEDEGEGIWEWICGAC
jgi:hypothetical protein